MDDSPFVGHKAIQYIEETLCCPYDKLLKFPLYIMIETINACNSSCVMCGIDFSKKKTTTMSKSFFTKLADEIITHRDHVKKVMLYLDGEPLLDKHLPGRVRQLKEGGIKNVNIASNASLLTTSKATEIIEAGLNEIYIAIDSLNSEVYESIRQGLKFDVVYDNIVAFIKLRDKLNPALKIRIQMILQKLNLNEEDSFMKHWEGILSSKDQIVVQKVHSYGAKVETMTFGDETFINNIPCIGPFGTFCVHVDGVVGSCSMDTDLSIPLGNVSERSIAEVWADMPFKRLRDRHIFGERHKIHICNGCGLWRQQKHDAGKILGTR